MLKVNFVIYGVWSILKAAQISQEAEVSSNKEVLKTSLERVIDKTLEEENLQISEENKDESDSVCTGCCIEKYNNFMIQCTKCTGWLHCSCT